MPWHVGLAVMLSQVGAIALPPAVLERIESHETLSFDEQAMVDRLPDIAEQVLAGIPRLEEVRAAIRWQNAPYGGTPGSSGTPVGDRLPLGARVLRLVQDYDALEGAGKAAPDALWAMGERS